MTNTNVNLNSNIKNKTSFYKNLNFLNIIHLEFIFELEFQKDLIF